MNAEIPRLYGLVFEPHSYLKTNKPLNQMWTERGIEQLKQYAKENDIPIDGIVITFNDVAYSKTCGRTGHHYKDGIAFKFEDEQFDTRLQSIEWNPTRSGEIAPVAIFDPVEIDGCRVSRASLHNLSFIKGLELMPGNHIKVSKRNMIIPHIEENLDRGGFSLEATIPRACPCCGQPTHVHASSLGTKTLFCDNPNCETRHLRKFVHFAGKKAMDIDGLSEATLEKLIGRGWLHSYMDLYRLDQHREEIIALDGFGEKSWQNLWAAIQHSRNTTFERYLIAMDIPMIGNTASRALARQFHSSLDEFEQAVVSGYGPLFAAAPLNLQLLDEEGQTVLAANGASPIPKSVWRRLRADMSRPLLRDRDTLLHAAPIRGGMVVWQEDMTELNRVRQELQTSSARLEAANALLSEEGEAKRRLLAAEAKATLFDELERELPRRVSVLAQLIQSLPQVEDRQRQTAYITLCLCHIKRRYNLFFLTRQGEPILGDELGIYLDELAELAGYAGVKALVRCGLRGQMDVRRAALCYDFYFEAQSWAVRENCSTMLGYLEREDTELAFKLLPACSPENWHFSEEFQAAVAAVGGRITSKDLDETAGVWLTIPLGGEDRG